MMTLMLLVGAKKPSIQLRMSYYSSLDDRRLLVWSCASQLDLSYQLFSFVCLSCTASAAIAITERMKVAITMVCSGQGSGK